MKKKAGNKLRNRLKKKVEETCGEQVGKNRVAPVRIGSVSKNLTLRLLGSVFSSVRFAGSGCGS